jgi:hypothetical protein
MPSPYARWMYNWETRLTSVDNNRVVRPLEWGLEWTQNWPSRNGHRPGSDIADPEKFLREYNQRIIASSDEFYSYRAISAWSSAKFRSSARGMFPIRDWKKKFAAHTRTFCGSLPRWRHHIQKII